MDGSSANEDNSDSNNEVLRISISVSTALRALKNRDVELLSEIDELRKKLNEKEEIVESLRETISKSEATAKDNEAKLAAAIEGEPAARSRAEKLEVDLKSVKKTVSNLKQRAKVTEAKLVAFEREEAAGATSRAAKLDVGLKAMTEHQATRNRKEARDEVIDSLMAAANSLAINALTVIKKMATTIADGLERVLNVDIEPPEFCSMPQRISADSKIVPILAEKLDSKQTTMIKDLIALLRKRRETFEKRHEGRGRLQKQFAPDTSAMSKESLPPTAKELSLFIAADPLRGRTGQKTGPDDSRLLQNAVSMNRITGKKDAPMNREDNDDSCDAWYSAPCAKKVRFVENKNDR